LPKKGIDVGGTLPYDQDMETRQVKFTAEQLETVCSLVAEAAMQAEDDGRDGSPESKLLWDLLKQLRKR
jgi:hypothetical protein